MATWIFSPGSALPQLTMSAPCWRTMLSVNSGCGLTSARAAGAAPASYPAPKTLGPVETYGANVQRSMTLLATSTALKRNTIRILFYGQSITADDWWKEVAEDLRRRFPVTDLVIENRAIRG